MHSFSRNNVIWAAIIKRWDNLFAEKGQREGKRKERGQREDRESDTSGITWRTNWGWTWSEGEVSFFFCTKIFAGRESFSWGHWYPCFGLLMTSPLGFKARVDLSLACFVACVSWIPEIHLWCNTCLLYRGQHGGRSHSLHACSRGSEVSL